MKKLMATTLGWLVCMSAALFFLCVVFLICGVFDDFILFVQVVARELGL